MLAATGQALARDGSNGSPGEILGAVLDMLDMLETAHAGVASFAHLVK